MKKVLILAGIYWNDPIQRHQQFTEYFSKMGYEVVFVEHVVSSRFTVKKFIDIVSNRNSGILENTNKVPANVSVINPGFVNPQNGLFKIVNKMQIRKLLKRIGSKFDIIINYVPVNTTRLLCAQLEYKKLVYDCVRNFENWEECSKQIIQEEKQLISKSDFVLTDSYYLTDKCRKSKDKVIQFLPVANEKWLEGCKHKKDVRSIKNIAYFGFVDDHIDVNAFKVLAEAGYKVHIWGMIESGISFEHVYHGYKNDLTELSSEIVRIADAIILPYPSTMDGVIPAKMMQSLSTYLPIFIGSFYDARMLSDYVYIYNSYDELIRLLDSYQYNDFRQKIDKIELFLEDKNELLQYEKFQNTFILI